MRTLLPAVLLLAGAPGLAACAADAPTRATDPAPTVAGMPTAVPAAPGPVHTRAAVTVLDHDGPVACLGPVAQSLPPQCDGPDLAGWDWTQHRGSFAAASGTRWGAYALSGGWDGETLSVDRAVPAAAYDPVPLPDPLGGAPTSMSTSMSTPGAKAPTADLAGTAREVAGLPGALGSRVDRGQVVVEVVYDDGSLQAWADRTYGAGVVAVTPVLLDGR